MSKAGEGVARWWKSVESTGCCVVEDEEDSRQSLLAVDGGDECSDVCSDEVDNIHSVDAIARLDAQMHKHTQTSIPFFG